MSATYSAIDGAQPAGPAQPAPRASYDPLRFCVYTTVALLAWLVSAPVMMMAMSALGLWAYGRAIRGGLTRTKCVLRSPRLVLGYLSLVFIAGAAALVWRLMH
ncbi:MAG TPA: hypothetical protein VN651_08285 [Gemmatimonadaceae bacterium]|nr:hypothetical protein [Gemmatimonadaceae bacterium]